MFFCPLARCYRDIISAKYDSVAGINQKECLTTSMDIFRATSAKKDEARTGETVKLTLEHICTTQNQSNFGRSMSMMLLLPLNSSN